MRRKFVLTYDMLAGKIETPMIEGAVGKLGIRNAYDEHKQIRDIRNIVHQGDMDIARYEDNHVWVIEDTFGFVYHCWVRCHASVNPYDDYGGVLTECVRVEHTFSEMGVTHNAVPQVRLSDKIYIPQNQVHYSQNANPRYRAWRTSGPDWRNT